MARPLPARRHLAAGPPAAGPAARPPSTFGVEAVPVADLKRRFSEYLDRVSRDHQRVIVRRHGRDVAALVPLDEVPATPSGPKAGLAAAAGALGDLMDVDAFLRDVYRARARGKDRPVPPLDD